MVDHPGLTTPEIAERYGRSLHTVTKLWRRAPDWPPPIGRRGKHYEYDPAAVDTWITEHIGREPVELEPTRLYTARELETAGVGITANTIRADQSRGRWPKPDDITGGANRWYGRTVQAALAKRRGYQRQHEEA